MICTKCGAPIPAGMHACPYCGAPSPAASGSRQPLDEETSFAEVDEGEFRSREDDKTEFAADGWRAAAPAAEETEYVQEPAPQPVRRPAPRKKAAAPKAAPRREKRPRKEKQPKPPKQKKQKPEADGAGHNSALRIVLAVVLAVLIVLLILRG